MSKLKLKSQPKSQTSLLSFFSKTPCSQSITKDKNTQKNANGGISKDNTDLSHTRKSPKNESKENNGSPKKNGSPVKKVLFSSPQKDGCLKSVNINISPDSAVARTNIVPTKKLKLSDEDDCIKLNMECLNKISPDFGFDEDFDINYIFDDELLNENLDLSNWQRCVVVEKNKEEFQLIVKLKSLTDAQLGRCILKDFWMNIAVEVDDIVSLVANKENDKYCISNKGGFFVLYPDNLISGTEIVGSLFCTRKSVLQNYFRGIDSGNKHMVIGVLVHELLQNCLKKKISSFDSISNECKEMLDDQQYKYMLFEIDMNENNAISEMTKYFTHISQFIDTYLNRKRISNNNKKWKGNITEVVDIEENIWSPRYGVSGRIDVTIEVNIHEKGIKKRLMPLELKTGKASNSAEHRGQVILYTMLMSEVLKNDEEISEGLLLYLRDSVNLQEVSATYKEKRDLILLRNKLSYSIEKWKNSVVLMDKIILPDPIDHHSACENCPYLTLCSLYMSNSGVELPNNHLLKKLEKDAIGHLTPEDIAYFLHWTRLLIVEDSESTDVCQRKDLWTLSPTAREKRGKCLSNLTLSSVTLRETNYKHTFKKSVSVLFSNNDFNTLLQPGEYVVISTCDKYGESSGTIDQIQKDCISVNMNKDLSKRNSSSTLYTIDGLDSKSTSEFNLSNLGVLMDNTEVSGRLRRIIVNKMNNKSCDRLSSRIIEKGKDILKQLNKVQQRAILQCITAEDFILIKGMPGTGKTQTIVALIKLLVKLDMSVLVTSHTHSAVDNIFLRLVDSDVKMLRLGSLSRINQKLHRYSESALTDEFSSVEAIKNLLNIKVVGVTCLGSGHPLLSKKTFDVCIVDESTQVLQYSIIRPLLYAKKFILVGDPDQLCPIVRSTRAKSLGLEESLFSRLDGLGSTVLLTLQYRMNKSIMKLANSLTYDNKLDCDDEKIANATIKIDHKVYGCINDHLIKQCLSPSIEDSVVIVDTGNTSSDSSTKYNNPREASIVLQLIKTLSTMSIEEKHIGVIAPYREQISLLKRVVKQDNDHDIEINTVDQYQGRDKDIIIYSCTKSYPFAKFINMKDPKDNQILEDKRRLTVAITRAKCKLIIIGDVAFLRSFKPFRELFEITGSNSTFAKHISIPQLQENNQFSWKFV